MLPWETSDLMALKPGYRIAAHLAVTCLTDFTCTRAYGTRPSHRAVHDRHHARTYLTYSASSALARAALRLVELG
jgi:hypothetical protein